MSYLFECVDCSKHYLPNEAAYVCPSCSAAQKEMEPLAGVLRCIYDYETISKEFGPEKLKNRTTKSFARWKEILPITSVDSLPPLIIYETPLRPVANLRREFGLDNLWIKDDTVQPTASFKDRASALVVACAREKGKDTVATASTGNAATALAGQAASVGIRSVIFAPASAPTAKLTQILVYGGTLLPIKGTYDEAFELSIGACNEFGWYNRNTAYNPFTVEGKKTAALEIWEQLGYKSPDWVIIPTGDGVILSGIEKGFADLKAMGLIEKMPKLAAAQAAGCQPIVRAWETKTPIVPELKAKTIADSISVGVPRAGLWAIKAIDSTGGIAVAVEDEEIIDAIAILGRTTGVFAEPAAATAVAALKKLAKNGTLNREDTVVTLVTGNGLKDIPAASRSVALPKAIHPDLNEVKKALE